MQGWDGNTFLYLSVDPSLLSLLVGLGLRNPRGLWIVSQEGPADFDATQHFVPSTALTAENNYRTTNVSKALSDTKMEVRRSIAFPPTRLRTAWYRGRLKGFGQVWLI